MKKYESINSENCDELTVIILGNVDGGKSTLIGSLVKNKLDDGNGSNRNLILRHPHEISSGRTSDINYQYIKYDNKIISFVDNPGHEVYLKTTIRGIISSYPDLAIVCISDKITSVTMEHIKLASMLDISILILMTKTDLIPNDITQELTNDIKQRLKIMRNPTYVIKTNDDLAKISNNLKSVVPILHISNKTGYNIPILKNIISSYSKVNHHINKCFTIEHVLIIHGFGLILIGTSGIDISIDDELYIGPFHNMPENFLLTKIRSIHNDYRYSVNILKAGRRGCICVKKKLKRSDIKNGMILMKEIPTIYKTITAKIKVMHHSTTISIGYIGYINCGIIRGPVKITKIYNKGNKSNYTSNQTSNQTNNEEEHPIIRTGDICLIDFEFVKRPYYIEIGQKIIIRESFSKLIGIITDLK